MVDIITSTINTPQQSMARIDGEQQLSKSTFNTHNFHFTSGLVVPVHRTDLLVHRIV